MGTPRIVQDCLTCIIARRFHSNCEVPVLQGTFTIVDIARISPIVFPPPQFTDNRGNISYAMCWLSIRAPYSYYERDGIAILAQEELVIARQSTISLKRQISPDRLL